MALPLGAIAWALSATPAHANFGTPAIWLAEGALVVGNFFIALVEGAFIAWRARTGFWRAFGAMLLANYFSAIAGWIAFASVVPAAFHAVGVAGLARWSGWLLLSLLPIAYLLTVVLERPMVGMATGGRPGAWRLSFETQALSYALIIPFYGITLYGGLTLYNRTTLVAARELPPVAARVYYVPPAGGIRELDLATGADRVLVASKAPPGPHPTLQVDPAGKAWVVSGAGGQAAIAPARGLDGRPHPHAFATRWGVADLRDPKAARWKLESDGHPGGYLAVTPVVGGLDAHGLAEGRYNLHADLPFFQDLLHDLTLLPGDQVVCDVGDHDLLRIDLATRKMAVLAAGSAPVVVLGAGRGGTYPDQP